MGFQQVPIQGRYVLLHPPIHQKDPEPGDLLPVGFLRGGGCKQVNPNSYPTPQAHNLRGGPGTWAYTDTTLEFLGLLPATSSSSTRPPRVGEGMMRPGTQSSRSLASSDTHPLGRGEYRRLGRRKARRSLKGFHGRPHEYILPPPPPPKWDRPEGVGNSTWPGGYAPAPGLWKYVLPASSLPPVPLTRSTGGA